MTDKPADKSEFDKALDLTAYYAANPKSRKTFRRNMCPICGQTINEGAYSGATGNLRKHVAACEKKRQR